MVAVTHIPDAVLGFFMPGGTEWIILLVLGLLIFGRRLPEVGRSLGKGIVEFKKGIKGIEDDIEDSSSKTPPAKLKEAEAPKLTERSEAGPAGEASAEADPYQAAEEGG